MHGRGTDENDLFPLFDMLDPDRRLLGLSPRGPLSLPPGGAHWYAVARIGYPDPGTFYATYPELTEWLDSTLEQHGSTTRRRCSVASRRAVSCPTPWAWARAGRPRRPSWR